MINRIWILFENLKLTGGLYIANDPFFLTRANHALHVMQVNNELKYELKFQGYGVSTAIASFNIHNNFFGRAFRISYNGAPAYTGCIGFGMERWVYSFLLTHGGGKLPSDLLSQMKSK